MFNNRISEEVSQPASSSEDSIREITPSIESDTDGMRSIDTEEIGPSTEKTAEEGEALNLSLWLAKIGFKVL